MRKIIVLMGFLALTPSPAPACSLCGDRLVRSMSLAYEFNEAAVVLYGTLANPQLDLKPGATPGRGTTDFHIDKIIKDDAAFPRKRTLVLSRYLPILDPKTPPKYVMFIRAPKTSLEPYWGKEIASPAVLDFVAQLHQHRKDPAQVIFLAGKHLDHADANIADEAFLIFAKTDDKLIAQTAKQLSPVNLRKLIKDPELEPERMSMFAYLLGACGNADDAELLRSLLKSPPERFYKSYQGILAGYITMRPDEGWAIAREMLKSDKPSFLLRYMTMRTMRFYYNAKPEETGPRVLEALSLAIGQADMADLAIEDLRKWKRWEHTKQIVACWDLKTYQTPLIRQSIVRYSLACPQPEARALVQRARRQDPELVRDLEQELK
ncbi:MAG: hypothetical protein EXR98_03345 [Gemmataceae bacterium]|nr:hypothetical protein [Gemmataceae bacterium]